MSTYLNRWTGALGWAATMTIVWTLFVPRGLSVTTFVLLGATGLLVLVLGAMLWASSRPPRSVGQILLDLESGSATAAAPAVDAAHP